MIDYDDMPAAEWSLSRVDIKEIINKYPDKIVDVIDRGKDVLIVMDTCKLILRK
jgi:hypothetical protein